MRAGVGCSEDTDMRGRKRLYQRLGMKPDETVDVDTVEAYYSQLK